MNTDILWLTRRLPSWSVSLVLRTLPGETTWCVVRFGGNEGRQGGELKGPGNKPSQQSEFKIANIKLFPARGELFIISS